jgi:metal-responsive CopG/Arc/MetJ family transcriptional regulator
MAELERPERLQIMLTADELAALENWRFEKRMPSRSAAVRELLRRGLASDGFLMAEQGVKSQEFGVLPDGEGKANDRASE